MSECNHDCGSCSANCDSRKADKSEFLEALNPASSVKKVIGVVSGKGGVGKSLVTSMLAVSMNRKGKKTAVLDADITGPSIPMAFGIGNEGVATSPDGKLMLPAKSMEGVEVMSANLLLDKDTDPVIWRGPVIAGAVKQFWSETLWQDVDYMFVDMPPGTGDVPLTVFQSLPVDGIIIVTSPQELVGMIVAKAVNMAKKMDIPIVHAAGRSSRRRTDVGQGRINKGQQNACYNSRLDGFPDDRTLLLHSLGPNIDSNDNSKIQGRNGIHGLISFQETCHSRA